MKNIIVLLLTAALLAASLASCGGAGGPAETSGSAETSGGAETSVSTETEYDPMASLVKLDGKGAEFKTLGYGERGKTGTLEYYTAKEMNGDVINDALFARNSEVEDMYNIKLVYNISIENQSEALKQMTSLALSGDKTYDIYVHKGIYLANLIESGAIAAWNGVKNIDTSNPWYAASAIDTHTVAKRTYGLFGDMLSTNTTMCWAFLFNKKLITDYKLGDPYEAVKSGKWTIDYLGSSTKEIAKDLDGDGKWTEADFYGFGADKFATLDAWQVSLGIYGVSKDKDDMPQVSFYSKRTVTAFEKVYSLYYNNVGTLVNGTAYGSTDVFAEDRCVYVPTMIDSMLGDVLRAMTTDYGVIPFPKLEESDESYSTYMHPRYGAVMLPVTVTEDRFELLGAIVEALGAASYKYVRPAIYDTALKVKTARDDESAEMLDLLIETRHYDFSAAFESLGTFPFTPAKAFRANLSSGSEFNVTSWYESVKSQAEATLQKFTENIK